MKPIPTERTTHTIRPIGEAQVELPLRVDAVGMESFWAPDEDDLAVLRDAAHVGIRLRVVGHDHPSVELKVVPLTKSPIVTAKPDENLTAIIRLNLERENHTLRKDS